MDNDINVFDRGLVEELIEEFIRRCNYIGNASLRKMLHKPAAEAAELCKQMKVDAKTYIDAHVAYAPVLRGQNSLIPNQIYCKDSKIWVQRAIDLTNEDDYKNYFEAQCRFFVNAVEAGWKEELCLLNPSFSFAPWFRVLMPAQSNAEINKKYGAQASHILNTNQKLTNFLKTVEAEDGAGFDFSRIPNFRP